MKIDMAGADSENSENLFLKLTMLYMNLFLCIWNVDTHYYKTRFLHSGAFIVVVRLSEIMSLTLATESLPWIMNRSLNLIL